MAGNNSAYSDTARALASQTADSDSPSLSTTPNRQTPSPSWQRRAPPPPQDQRPRWMQSVESVQNRGLKLWSSFTPVQRAGILGLSVVLLLAVILGLIYNERIFAYLAPAAKRWHDLRGGWLILWFMTFFVSFPPMIGYSTCVTIAGFVFGMKGWLIVSTATVLGSTASFIVSRTVLRSFVGKLTEKNQRFQALSLVLKHDGLKLLVMIRLCPLPYSISNGAISTIPTVTWQNFMLATALATPKLLLHVFVGARLGDIAENGDKMDSKSKMVSYISILIGLVAGVATGYFIYVRTQARAKELEAEEAAAATAGRRTSETGADYIDNPDEDDAANAPRPDDAVSMHTTYERDLERGRTYTDEFTDDEDAREQDVFDIGDGDDEGIWKQDER